MGINTFGVTITHYNQAGEVTSEASVDYALNVEELIPLLDKNGVPYQLGKNSFPLLAVILGVVVVAVIVAAAVLVGRSRRTQPAAARAKARPAPQPAPQPQANPILRSLSAQHGGATVSVAGQQGVLVGRDGSVCGIVFKEGTPGVSARHCSVVWDGRTGEFLLTDLKSTYGTFLATGQKLTPGVACRLKAGDTFYLGEQSNALRVELG